MTPRALLAELRRFGVTFGVDRDEITFRHRKGAQIADLLEELSLQKPAVLALLRAEAQTASHGPATAAASPSVAAVDDGRRVWIRAMGEILEWPRLPLSGAEAIASGEPAWIAFTSAPANAELVDRAVTVLLGIDDPGTDQP